MICFLQPRIRDISAYGFRPTNDKTLAPKSGFGNLFFDWAHRTRALRCITEDKFSRDSERTTRRLLRFEFSRFSIFLRSPTRKRSNPEPVQHPIITDDLLFQSPHPRRRSCNTEDEIFPSQLSQHPKKIVLSISRDTRSEPLLWGPDCVEREYCNSLRL